MLYKTENSMPSYWKKERNFKQRWPDGSPDSRVSRRLSMVGILKNNYNSHFEAKHLPILIVECCSFESFMHS